MLTATRAAELISETSARLCRVHHEMRPDDPWCYGGPAHNDDRLTATVESDLTIRVTDGNAAETYSGPLGDAPIRAFVQDWLSDVWANR
jgi:hypothetical protein